MVATSARPSMGGEERMMAYDLVIKNGWVVDGSGMPRYRDDVGVTGGRIVTIGRIRESAREVIDAEGRVVSPGFVDGHTHMDAQVFWDPLGTCSSWHGVTSVVMGNCGFTLAPCAKSDRHLVVRNLERAEDIAAEAMDAGIDWTWTTFPEFLDAVAALPKGINYAGYLGHSALRTYVMGERAFEQPATEDDLTAMERALGDGLRAGAIGFTTSRSPSHETPDRRPVASRLATWDEVRRLVGVMGKLGAGIFELAGEAVGRTAADLEGLREYHKRLRDLAVETGRPITWGLFSRREAPEIWRIYLDLLEDTAAAGGRMFAQVHSRALTVLLSFETSLPFDRLPVWRELRALPLAEQRVRLRDPELRRRLVEAARERDERDERSAEEGGPAEPEHDGDRGAQRRAAGDAKNVGLGERVPEDGLKSDAHHREPSPGQGGEGDPRQARLDDDHAIERLRLQESARERQRLRPERDGEGKGEREEERGRGEGDTERRARRHGWCARATAEPSS
jgi:N-acyl-D-amino-acid deacylase